MLYSSNRVGLGIILILLKIIYYNKQGNDGEAGIYFLMSGEGELFLNVERRNFPSGLSV